MTDARELGFDPARLARLDKHFARYVDDGRLPGWQLSISRHGQLAHESSYGWRDREAGLVVEPDTIWRIASMTKPVTAVVAMTLWEEGAFELTDPISRWLPEFANPQVYVRGIAKTMVTEPATEPIRVWHLLTHTSGLSAGFMYTSVVGALYRAIGYEWGAPRGHTLQRCIEDWSALPLLHQPGKQWSYGVSQDVLGRLIEIWSGQPLDVAFRSRLLDPLGMDDTGFEIQDDKADRFTALYLADEQDLAVRVPADNVGLANALLAKPTVLSGGGGLISTASDYRRFAQMLLNGGTLDGTRVLSSRTVALMTKNHLDGDLDELSTGGFAETTLEGVGFGFGGAVLVDPVKAHSVANAGEYYWGGAFSTAFWIDPVEELSCVFMTQLMPSSAHPIRSQLRQLVYSALVD